MTNMILIGYLNSAISSDGYHYASNVSTNMRRSNMKFYNLSFFSGYYCFDEFFGKS